MATTLNKIESITPPTKNDIFSYALIYFVIIN